MQEQFACIYVAQRSNLLADPHLSKHDVALLSTSDKLRGVIDKQHLLCRDISFFAYL